MAMTERDDDRTLDAVFAQARRHAPEPSADLLARVLADAEAVQAALPARPLAHRAATTRRGTGLGGVFGLLGGWGGLGGLVAAGLTGLWIGFTGTGALGSASAGFWGAVGTVEAGLEDGDILTLTLALEGDA